MEELYNEMLAKGFIKDNPNFKNFSVQAFKEWITLNENTRPNGKIKLEQTDTYNGTQFEIGVLPNLSDKLVDRRN